MVRGREAVRRARFGLSAWRLASCATLSLAGCATVPMGEPGEDEALKRFAVAPDQAGLYVFRHPVAGAAVRMDLELDGAPLGKTIGGTYLFSALAPGRHTLVSRAENTDTLVFDVAAGELAFVRQDVRWGLMYARTKLQRVDEAEGSRGWRKAPRRRRRSRCRSRPRTRAGPGRWTAGRPILSAPGPSRRQGP
jgi:hypothetical protein